ncbi:hypothetical protein [Curtobacterium sp. MCBD17_008]|uniref:hypothetical protein n=1 Tax=Curtobacterium sp. MCBD17_008 TaxID=2175656 RepID=UPI000DA94094|nr:hypothetical protein [Curtobacterium sp. MCBD17_008]PZE90459.1 hypothetical protein DEI95_11925 [Curtobacterium sp. MCBD17_008]
MKTRTVVLNPLGAALLHYRRELVSVLEASGQPTEVLEFPEPSAGGGSRSKWVLRYVQALWDLRRRGRSATSFPRVVVTWPVLGYLDLLIITACLPGAWLTVHDPVPLVRSLGYGRLSRFLARRLGGRAKIIVLSEAAAAEVSRALPAATLTRLPHPILEPEVRRSRPSETVVRVLGQYKADRDLELLKAIAEEGSATHYAITGRGWPALEGWSVDDRFVPESELYDLIRSASVVLIPYRRFFQSGIAVRCLELGTPVVGPKNSSLRDLLATHEYLLADGRAEDWARAATAAIALSAEELRELSGSARARSERLWGQF